MIIIHAKGNNPLAILDFWCVWRNSHQCGMSRQLFDNDDPQKSQLGERIPFPSYLALLHRQFLSSDKHHHNFPSFRIRWVVTQFCCPLKNFFDPANPLWSFQNPMDSWQSSWTSSARSSYRLQFSWLLVFLWNVDLPFANLTLIEYISKPFPCGNICRFTWYLFWLQVYFWICQ